jgi:hypothetical protein
MTHDCLNEMRTDEILNSKSSVVKNPSTSTGWKKGKKKSFLLPPQPSPGLNEWEAVESGGIKIAPRSERAEKEKFVSLN